MNRTVPKPLRVLSFVLLFAAFVYGLVLPFCWGNDPSDKYGTLSLLCENRIGWFWLWTVLTGGAFSSNLLLLWNERGDRSRHLRVLLVLAMAGMLLTAATLHHSIQTLNPKRVLHWTGAILYAVFLGAAFLFFFFKNAKKDRRILALLLLSVLTLVGVVLQLFVFGRNGYMEIVPLAVFELELFLLNFTPFGRAKAEAPVKAEA